MVFSFVEPLLSSLRKDPGVIIIDPCLTIKCNPTVIQTTLDFFSVQYFLQYIMVLLNQLTQLLCIVLMIKRKFIRKSSFFKILLILSITVSFRVIFSIISIIATAIIGDPSNNSSIFLLQSSLYVDYCTNFFSLSLVFLMSLNRCFCFVAERWDTWIFKGSRVVFPLIFCVLVSIGGGVTAIRSSEIRRTLVDHIGFVDVGPNKGWRIFVNRLFYVFPLGSVICYAALFFHLRKRKTSQIENSSQTKGEQLVVFHLLITSILYGLLSVAYEITLIICSNASGPIDPKLTFIAILNIFNKLPEMCLPLLFVCTNVQIRKRVSIVASPNVVQLGKRQITRSVF